METQIQESFSQCRIPELNSPQTCSRLPPLTADIRCKNSLFPLPLPAPYRICRACVVRAVRVSVASHGPCVVDGCPTGRRRDLSPWLPATSDRLGPCPPLVRLGHPPPPLPAVFISPTPFFSRFQGVLVTLFQHRRRRIPPSIARTPFANWPPSVFLLSGWIWPRRRLFGGLCLYKNKPGVRGKKE